MNSPRPTFVCNSWGNSGDGASAAEVTQVRTAPSARQALAARPCWASGWLCCAPSLRFYSGWPIGSGAQPSLPGWRGIPKVASSQVSVPHPDGQATEKESVIRSFFLDCYPVSNGEFLRFVKEHPRWQQRGERLRLLLT